MSPKTELELRDKIAALEERVRLLELHTHPVCIPSVWPVDTPAVTYTITSTGGISNDFEVKKPG